MICLKALIIALNLFAGTQQPPAAFTADERSSLQTFWSSPGRYAVTLPPDAATRGPWQVRLTPDGSSWLLKYQNAIGARGVAPTVDPTGLTLDRSTWKTWVTAKIARDRQRAQDAADAANRAVQPVAASPQPNKRDPLSLTQAVAADPGPIPPSLLAAVGNPPAFASAVTPMQYSVTYDDGELLTYQDNVMVPQTYAYYRFPQGVAVYGGHTSDAELAASFASAGMTASEQRIALAVSKLEGSFESINTYDTGYVSVGFLQFITLDDGKHSLCDVLQREKKDRPNDFAGDFHKYGVEITAEGVIEVVDPSTGAELIGPDAVRKLVEDKRLISVFQRAGRHSTAFRVAQIQVAKARYWPADDAIVINTGTVALAGKVSDVVHSEAGIATLFDRKVNRGGCEPITAVVAKIIQDHGLTNLADASHFERDIITALKYRGDFLKDPTLQQPDN